MEENEVMVEETTEIDAEKQEKFMVESKERMAKICTQISYLEKIATKRSVDYTKENVEKMFSYLSKELDDCKAVFMARFEEKSKSENFDFEF